MIRDICLFLLLVVAASAQTYRVCVLSSDNTLCTNLDKEGQAACLRVESRVDCALKLSRGEADIGYFTEEEVLLLAQQQPNERRVVASIRDVTRMEPYAFEAVAVVPANHTSGLEGLRGGRYCHPGLTQERWSPRVLKTLEQMAAQTDHCPTDGAVHHKTADQLEVEALNGFFSAACRPGPWSSNATVDAALKRDFPSLCSLCGGTCDRYSINMGVEIAGASNSNPHIQALECLRANTNNTAPSVAYAAWLHVREYFTARNPADAASFSVLCPDGTLQPLSVTALANTTAPCAFVRQPWPAVVTATADAANILGALQAWWPTGSNPNDNSWQSVAFEAIVGGANARVVFETTPLSVANYTNPVRSISNIDSTASCLPARRWCTLSAAEQTKCTWVRAAAYSLGILPALSCQQRPDMFTCLKDIAEERADFISSPSNYGFLARQHYKLTPVKLVQNQRSAASRVAAFVKRTSAQTNITRFENLRNSRACFPEYGGLAFVAFVRAAQERGVISASECDYGKAVSEFFSGACAPGAVAASHNISDVNFDASNLCSLCRPANGVNASTSMCSFDYSNMYYGNNGSLACLADPNSDVAVLSIQNIDKHLAALNLQPDSFQALCRNNSLAVNPGVNIDDNCALAYVVDAEVLTRRQDSLYNALNVLLDSLDQFFGYNAGGSLLINLEIFSPFDGTSHLLFRDSTIGLTEPTSDSTHEPARNYIQLFQHLQTCTGAAPPAGGFGTRSVYSAISLVVLSVLTRFLF